jgi:hypothetical protein
MKERELIKETQLHDLAIRRNDDKNKFKCLQKCNRDLNEAIESMKKKDNIYRNNTCHLLESYVKALQTKRANKYN